MYLAVSVVEFSICYISFSLCTSIIQENIIFFYRYIIQYKIFCEKIPRVQFQKNLQYKIDYLIWVLFWSSFLILNYLFGYGNLNLHNIHLQFRHWTSPSSLHIVVTISIQSLQYNHFGRISPDSNLIHLKKLNMSVFLIISSNFSRALIHWYKLRNILAQSISCQRT